MVDYVKYCREQADDTFYDPLKESWTMVGDHIEKLEAALREITWIATPNHEEARHKATEIARKALEKNDG
jgi:hypothetical protein